MDYMKKLKPKKGYLGFLSDGFCWCCGAPVDIMGLVGMVLLMIGVIQIGCGSYFMLILPIFDVASNIWTGIVTGSVGAVVMYFGSTNQTRPRAYTNLTLSLIALIINIINIVIIIVGENSTFLSEKDKLRIDHEHKNQQFTIAIWLTSSLSVATSLITFSIAQYIFCIQLRLGTRKSKSPAPEVTSPHAVSASTERFFPPSRMATPKVVSPSSDSTSPFTPSLLPDNASLGVVDQVMAISNNTPKRSDIDRFDNRFRTFRCVPSRNLSRYGYDNTAFRASTMQRFRPEPRTDDIPMQTISKRRVSKTLQRPKEAPPPPPGAAGQTHKPVKKGISLLEIDFSTPPQKSLKNEGSVNNVALEMDDKGSVDQNESHEDKTSELSS